MQSKGLNTDRYVYSAIACGHFAPSCAISICRENTRQRPWYGRTTAFFI